MEKTAYPNPEDSTEITAELESLLDLTSGPPASTGIRFANYLIDCIAIYLCSFCVGSLLALARLEGLLGTSGYSSAYSDEHLRNLLWYILLTVLYYTLMEGLSGKTIGKLCTGTKVVRETGERITMRDALLR